MSPSPASEISLFVAACETKYQYKKYKWEKWNREEYCTYSLGSVVSVGLAGTKVLCGIRVNAELLCALGVVLDLAGVVDLVIFITSGRLALELNVVGGTLALGRGLLLFLGGLFGISLVGQFLSTLVRGLDVRSIVVGGLGRPEVPAGWDGDGNSTDSPSVRLLGGRG